MTTENELIKKSYYQTILDQTNRDHPIKVLGEMYMEEMRKERPELASIRFAQGEVYFLNSDYEAAIYKWQQLLDGPFIPWAQKNIADAHMELGLLEYAEKFYKEVETDSVTLKMEVLLQLFSLYIQQNQQDKSVRTIKEAVRLNPDYDDVTEIARRYFEDIQDWGSAIELAMSEALRTESLVWFDCLEGYSNLECIANYEPDYFTDLLVALWHLDPSRFENLTQSLWKRYEQSEHYFQWLEEINRLMQTHDLDQSHSWNKLRALYQEAYVYLTSGTFLIKDISYIMPDHVTNWFLLSSHSDHVNAATAILAWNKMFPAELNETLVNDAEAHLKNSNPSKNAEQEGLELLESIKLWAEKEGLLEGLTEFIKPMVKKAGTETESPKEIRTFIQDILTYMLKQKAESENSILQDINRNKDMLAQLREYQQKISARKKEKAEILTSSFRELKNKLTERAEVKLPELLRNCSELVREDTDFSKLHADLNEEMNKRIAEYMKNDFLPAFKQTSEKWIKDAEYELQESQQQCLEIADDINEQFAEDKLVFSFDFKVLDDWQRDLDRASRILFRRGKVNIWLRNNPSQLFLKGAGKFLGSFSKNKDMILNKYKDHIEKADYREIARETLQSFMQQLELFEESIEWDVGAFFSDSQEALRGTIDNVEENIVKHTESLDAMRERPEIYQDPIKLFELRLQQYELKHITDMQKA